MTSEQIFLEKTVAGFSLLEVLVSITIVTVIVVGEVIELVGVFVAHGIGASDAVVFGSFGPSPPTG